MTLEEQIQALQQESAEIRNRLLLLETYLAKGLPKAESAARWVPLCVAADHADIGLRSRTLAKYCREVRSGQRHGPVEEKHFRWAGNRWEINVGREPGIWRMS